MVRKFSRISLIVISGLGLTAKAADAGRNLIANGLEAVVPSELKPLLLENPQVRFLVTLDGQGKLVDSMATEATHHGLLEQAEKTLRQAAFTLADEPGTLGLKTYEVVVKFYDPEQRAYRYGLIARPLGGTSFEAVDRRLYTLSKHRFVYREAQSAELDRPLKLVSAQIKVMADAEGQPAEGACVISFYVDWQGRVRLPRVIKTDNEAVALSALMTLQHTLYEPVTRSGAPAWVKASQVFSFAPPARQGDARVN